ncbi:UNVERIFIED_CONTAM: hypothetical protein K2H54_075939 [Gekko kuhli]
MDEEQPLSACSQYPKEALRKRQHSGHSSRDSDSSRASRKSFRLDYREETESMKSLILNLPTRLVIRSELERSDYRQE